MKAKWEGAEGNVMLELLVKSDTVCSQSVNS